MATNYISEVSILTTKVTQVIMDPINICFYTVEYNSGITQVRLGGDISEVLGFRLLARTVSIIIWYL